jgi:hypothetical protein
MNSKTIYYYQYPTNQGVISLIPIENSRYKVMFQDEHLGSYVSAVAAADDVGGGYTDAPSCGVDFADLEIPRDLSEWTKKVFAEIQRLRPSR